MSLFSDFSRLLMGFMTEDATVQNLRFLKNSL